jgi:hypothetical protein
LDPSCGSTLGLTGFNFCNKTGLDSQPCSYWKEIVNG